MLKRKAAVNDIIYELDNDDIEISSDDEAKEAKIHRSDKNAKEKPSRKKTDSEEACVEVVNLDSTIEGEAEVEIQTCVQNGGKTSPNIEVVDSVGKETVELETEERSKMEAENQTDIISDSNRTIYNEDIIIDSPTSNSDLGVVGCENRTPLVTIKFKDKNFAKRYKEEVKLFMLKLIKLHEEDSQVDSDSITDLEVDIWPEDLTEDDTDDVKEEVVEDSLFFVDTDPSMRGQNVDVPTYRQNTSLISDTPDKEQSPPRVLRRGPTCFNCDGAHALRDCPLPRNNQKIAENRKNMAVKVGRYHVEDDQKYGHLVPGRISGNLRHALGLKRNELPLYIYRMRMLGYPPGWLEEARISHSGISMFDSSGQAILDPEDEEGELCEPGSKDKFDIKKILDFPGFNVPASSRYTEEAHQYGLPPLSDQDSKLAMLQMLAPNAMKAYKRKKLTLMPSASANNTLEGQAEMDIDSGDEAAAFPSVPPLPDEAPPPAPPPPPPPPEDECEGDKSADDKSDLEVIEVIKVPDIPVPEDELITIDDDISSDRSSPSLRDLEETKRRLMSALENSDVSTLEDEDRVQQPESKEEMSKEPVSEERTSQEQMSEEDKSQEEQSNNQTPNDQNESVVESTVNSQESSVVSEKDPETKSQSDSDIEPKTPKTGAVKTTDYGTPIMNIASSYTKLPSDEKFSKNISDVINFENLPNSTGKYKQISVLLRKVKDEVDRIQES